VDSLRLRRGGVNTITKQTKYSRNPQVFFLFIDRALPKRNCTLLLVD